MVAALHSPYSLPLLRRATLTLLSPSNQLLLLAERSRRKNSHCCVSTGSLLSVQSVPVRVKRKGTDRLTPIKKKITTTRLQTAPIGIEPIKSHNRKHTVKYGVHQHPLVICRDPFGYINISILSSFPGYSRFKISTIINFIMRISMLQK